MRVERIRKSSGFALLYDKGEISLIYWLLFLQLTVNLEKRDPTCHHTVTFLLLIVYHAISRDFFGSAQKEA